MMRQFELVELVKSYDPNADEGALNRAYVYSMKAHGAQLRASGDPYFSHPIQVAGLLAQMKLDSASIVTGLLHDTIEDTVATLDEHICVDQDAKVPATRDVTAHPSGVVARGARRRVREVVEALRLDAMPAVVVATERGVLTQWLDR